MKFNFKKYKAGLLALIAISTVTSCKKYLDEPNRSNFTQQNYFTTGSQARAFVNGIYGNNFNNGQNYGSYIFLNGDAYGEAPFITLELFAGHATSLGQSVNNNNVIFERTDPTNPGFETMWKGSYTAIAECNIALNRIPSISMDDAAKKSLLGEAYFLRAFFYYHLVRLYGDVPLITTPVDLNSTLLYPARTPKEQVYDQVVNDLLAAEQSGLPATNGMLASMGAVHTLLSSVYLTMAGYPLQKTENYQKAADEAKLALPSYTLFTDYAYLHDNAHKNQGELIFQANYDATKNATNAITQLTVPFNQPVGVYGDHLGAMIPTDAFFNSYEAGDKRTQEKQFYFSQYPASDGNSVVIFGEHCLYKYFHVESSVSGTANSGKCDENWTFLRLPEAMLTFAEASNEVNGPTADAYDAVNQIRARANLAPLAGLTKDQFRIAIWKERYHELAFEDKSYFDIQRTHQIYDVKNNTFGPATSTPNEQGVTMKDQYFLWPVPQREIATNNKLTQNTGW
ncbi:RagB/SusD family nutrient uptake outer membrane protein [Mucilaginibacter aquaedulcis]|uniref:RagB/SusD family nutrient uptake outer membrane protein n=1 Tax=Mucilaginibacter aquaedulcis TaxID=1187081 RepID=UPI0025B2E387|nr:RagB/SusD family nutrient uptake outer membrane protein [Mucilaginibacter aquaedulcis]MDN3546989.1 RagB/SusD family nutrient uptake outer membrane protein [Mucilaginibacter aquaedulcis]